MHATGESRRSPNGAAAVVHDRSSLAAFITALAEDRSDADRQEQQHPNRYAFERAHGWEVTSLAAYLSALAQELEAAPTDAVSWAGLAQVLLAAKGRTPMDGA
ncbi:hypothetical protein [Deinococcus humi]|uniref:Uncharacterized protein n=1 Tax=Deinococcus humi TaxID=662880 RepID=A0A7W8NHQ5_9DEIO|nr:hypothetical protein [Deinococcus humi]MBB5366135.1 hypothetical protein [Deinococcus humi]GGO40248.1 hypothetical protein GCM10008949_49520 [Deinococcus humi]